MARQAVSNTTRRKSSVWKDFDYVDVPGASAMATCKRCGTTYKACPKKDGTSALLRHAGSPTCAKRAANRGAPCLQAAPPAGHHDDEEGIAKWVDELLINPYEAGNFPMEEQQDGGLTARNRPFTDRRQEDGGSEVAATGDQNRTSTTNIMTDATHVAHAQSSSSMRFLQMK